MPIGAAAMMGGRQKKLSAATFAAMRAVGYHAGERAFRSRKCREAAREFGVETSTALSLVLKRQRARLASLDWKGRQGCWRRVEIATARNFAFQPFAPSSATAVLCPRAQPLHYGSCNDDKSPRMFADIVCLVAANGSNVSAQLTAHSSAISNATARECEDQQHKYAARRSRETALHR